MCEKHKACAIIGHRRIEITEELKKQILVVVVDLVENKGVKSFLFGSKSAFNDLCYDVISSVTARYSFIERVVYTCKNEAFVDVADKREIEHAFEKRFIRDKVLVFDREVEYDEKFVSRKESYIKRNYSMIDDSDYCLFYYDISYATTNNKGESTNSGTALAYQYALKKRKVLINIFSQYNTK